MENALHTLIRLALEEDIGKGDLTAAAVPEGAEARARLVAKESVVVSGLGVVPEILRVAKSGARLEFRAKDGERLEKGAELLRLSGNARELLALERVILNFLQRLCGIATASARYAEAAEGTGLMILDTRKTTPGFRALEKKAVRDGGLHNHRFSLDTGILVKENHIRAAGGIEKAVKALRKAHGSLHAIEVEVTNRSEAFTALELGVKRLLLDNFSPSALAPLVRELKGMQKDVFLEASGGITFENLREYAAAGADAVSIGALTHSVRAADLSLLFEF